VVGFGLGFKNKDWAAVTLARPLHVSKVSQSKEKGKTWQATNISEFKTPGSTRGENGQDQEWMSCRILAILFGSGLDLDICF